jgi:hypothetical protein
MAKAPTKAHFDEVVQRFRVDEHSTRTPEAQQKVQQVISYLTADEQWREDWAMCSRIGQQQDMGARRYGFVTSNAAEVLNSVFRNFRALPLCAALDRMITYSYTKYIKMQGSFMKNMNDDEHLQNFRTDPAIQRQIAPGEKK